MAKKKGGSAAKPSVAVNKSGGGKTAAAKSAGAKTAPKRKSNTPLIVVAVAVVAVIGILFAANVNAKKASAQVPAAEAKYLGRYLPKSYVEPKVGQTTVYTQTITETPVQTTDGGSTLSIPLNDVVNDKIVSFTVKRADGQTVPMLAYVKPSGKLFLGVNYCVPCQGVGQRIESDGTLTCQTCGTKRNLETGVGIGGACKLYPLDEFPVTVSGGKISVQKSLIDNWTMQPKDRPIGAS